MSRRPLRSVIEAARLPATRDDRRELASVYREDPFMPVLAALRPEPDDAVVPVVVAPVEGPHLTDTPRRDGQKPDDIAEDIGQAGGEGLHLLAGEEAAAHPRLVRVGDRPGAAVRRKPPRPDRQREHSTQERHLQVDGRRRCTLAPPSVDVALRPAGLAPATRAAWSARDEDRSIPSGQSRDDRRAVDILAWENGL